MATQKIPITAITGFLGSGKTTLLNHILENNHGLKIGVVVNDYGDINIDAKLVAGQTDAMLELTNGCMCCAMDDMELDEAISQFAHQGSQIDYIIIEASGLAEPADLAITLRDAMGSRAKLDSIVAVLDAVNLEHNAETNATALQQIEYSDFVLINKVDLVDAERVAMVRQLVTGVNPRVRTFESTQGRIDVRLLLDQSAHIVPEEVHAEDHDHKHHQHLHDSYSTTSFTTNKPLDPIAFQQFVNERLPTAIYRAKGFVHLGKKGHGRKYVFQLVGKRADLSWTDWGEETPQTQLVFIGKDFDKAELRKSIEACIDTDPDAVDPERQVVLPRRAR